MIAPGRPLHHPNIAYLSWAREVYGSVRFDLGASDSPTPSWAELGLDPATLPLSGDHREGPPALLDAVARTYGTTPDRVFCGAGGAGVAGCLFRGLLRPGDHVLCEHPSYEPLWRVPEGIGAEVEWFPRPLAAGAPVDPDAVAARLRPDTQLVVLTDLHNPSGRTLDEETLRRVGEAAASVGARVLVDEVYLEFLGPDARPAATLGDGFISVNSITKVLGLGHVRIGWALAAPDVVRRAARALLHDLAILPCPSVAVALAALDRREALIARARSGLADGARQVAAWADGRDDVDFLPPDGGRVGWLRLLRPGVTGRALADRLLADHGAVVGPGDFFGDPSGVRLGFGLPPGKLAAALDRVGAVLDSF